MRRQGEWFSWCMISCDIPSLSDTWLPKKRTLLMHFPRGLEKHGTRTSSSLSRCRGRERRASTLSDRSLGKSAAAGGGGGRHYWPALHSRSAPILEDWRGAHFHLPIADSLAHSIQFCPVCPPEGAASVCSASISYLILKDAHARARAHASPVASPQVQWRIREADATRPPGVVPVLSSGRLYFRSANADG